ncbi:MAG: DUF4382 domain-containing protein [Bacteroidales bacterium]|nr:DUF4382 domain-containing protein [Bacteroidales bacterium]
MMIVRKWFFIIVLGIVTPLIFTQCSDDDDNNEEKGTVNFKMTDAPIDDADVEAVFVTVSEVKVDGEAVNGFEKQTIDLTAYQEGNTEVVSYR